MDEEIKKKLSKEMMKFSLVSKFRFLDSGNYHHFSFLYTSFIKEPFHLVVFDNHTDMQESAFGSILSCGSWILEAIEKNPNLNKVIMIGVKEEYRKACPYQNDKRVLFLSNVEEADEEILDLPIYLSIDKDVLSEEDFICDWDQGEMRLSKLLSELKFLKERANLLGIDVCGEPEAGDREVSKTSSFINREILNVFSGFSVLV